MGRISIFFTLTSCLACVSSDFCSYDRQFLSREQAKTVAALAVQHLGRKYSPVKTGVYIKVVDGAFGSELESRLRKSGFSLYSNPKAKTAKMIHLSYTLDCIEQGKVFVDVKTQSGYRVTISYDLDRNNEIDFLRGAKVSLFDTFFQDYEH